MKAGYFEKFGKKLKKKKQEKTLSSVAPKLLYPSQIKKVFIQELDFYRFPIDGFVWFQHKYNAGLVPPNAQHNFRSVVKVIVSFCL